MQKHLQIKITGRVQGIGFRFESYQQFADFGLIGTAENKSDGSIEIDVKGEEAALQKFVDWARKGPVGARVENVEVLEIPIIDEENNKTE